MKYAIIIDSIAALPESFIKERSINVLPLNIIINGKSTPDYTSEKELLTLYASGQIHVKADIDTSPPTPEEMKAYFLEKIVPKYDVAVCQSVAKSLSGVYENINSVAHSIARDSRRVRNHLGISQPFRITYMSSGTTGAGQGLVAIYAEAALSQGMDYTKYKILVSRFKSSVKGFTIVKDIVYSRGRARRNGQDVVNLPTAIIGKLVGIAPIVLVQNNHVHPPIMQRGFAKSVERLFTYATARIKEELYFDCVNIGIAGSPKELETYPAFHELREAAQQKGVSVMVSVLTLASSINFSPGCIALGIAPKDQVSLP